MTEQQIEQSQVEKLRDLNYTIRRDIRGRASEQELSMMSGYFSFLTFNFSIHHE